MGRSKQMHTHLEVEIAPAGRRRMGDGCGLPERHAWRRGITEMTPDQAGVPQVGTKVHEVLRSEVASTSPTRR